jgi:Lon protease-like protein
MARSRHIGTDTLPEIVPVFSVSGAILLAGGTLPLMAFEPRFLALVDDVLGAGRLFGLVQPRDDNKGNVPGLFDTGCLARITAFGETPDGRYLITASGMCRFRVVGEAAAGRDGYRRVQADYAPYRQDLNGGDGEPIDRRSLLTIIRTYFSGLGMAADLPALEKASDSELSIRLAMACPFSPTEKQALLEAPSHLERCRLMTAMIQRELLEESGASSTTIH